MEPHDRWLDFLSRLEHRGAIRSSVAAEAAFGELDRRYREVHRAYHTWEHICRSLDELTRIAHHAVEPHALEAAIWMHDVVYDPKRRDNERRSARLARRLLRRIGLAPPCLRSVAGFILSTAYFAEEAGRVRALPDACLMRDIDLVVLGRPAEEFDAYEAAIRREYSFLDDAAYRHERRDILVALDGLYPIYGTAEFGARYERQAHANLRRLIAALGDPTSSGQGVGNSAPGIVT